MEEVVLVDNHDNAIGFMEKMEAHREGVLHRAFSVFLFNDNAELLLQKRAEDKYHSGGLWTNTCCSHPRPDEAVLSAATRRLMEEMGIICELTPAFTFTYKSQFENGLIEHELDHVLIGEFNGEPSLNREEATDWRYVSLSDLAQELENNSSKYTAWLKIAFPKLQKFLADNPSN